MIYLLDTNVVAELTTRPRPAPAVVTWARSVPAPDLRLSVITIAEIEAGIARTPDAERRILFERALAAVRDVYSGRIVGIGEREASAYLDIHHRLKKTGVGIDPPDALIAATAAAHGWTVATRNVKHLVRTGALVLDPWQYAT
ncbi:PIN domain-containing protein [Streptomyces sp. NPDC006660]|uniref:PIN domain-containing protein n=1 Tax=unclassified Streptomyces TaxID=2593676 RepID=UPI0033D12E80